MPKVVLEGYILVPDNDLEVVKRELVTHSELSNKELGCLTFNVTQDEGNVNKFNVYEEFIDQISFDKHQARVKSSKWGKVTRNVSRHYRVSYR